MPDNTLVTVSDKSPSVAELSSMDITTNKKLALFKKKSNDNDTCETLEQQLKLMKENLLRMSLDPNALKKYKKTDFRREQIVKQLNDLRKYSRMSKSLVSVKFGAQPKFATAITVDTSRSSSNTDVVRLVLQELGWREYPNGKSVGCCDLCWNSVNYHENANIGTGYVNKFPGITTLLHKVNLSRTLDIMRQLFPDDYAFYPETWYLPHQLNDFTAHVRAQRQISHTRRSPGSIFIVKPDEGTQGDGIYLIREPEEFRITSKNYVVQEYLSNPLLLDGYKFDLRIYVVVRSISPLKIYICKEGMARFCTVPYQQPNPRNIHDTFMHLTNYSLNKKSSSFVHSDNINDGSKRTLSSVFHRLLRLNYDVTSIWRHIEALVVKTILAVVPELKVYMHADNPQGKPGPSFFQIMGFDVLVLDDLRAILLEVNSNPSMRLDTEVELAPGIPEYFTSPVDVVIKRPLVRDTLKLMATDIKTKRRNRKDYQEMIQAHKQAVAKAKKARAAKKRRNRQAGLSSESSEEDLNLYDDDEDLREPNEEMDLSDDETDKAILHNYRRAMKQSAEQAESENVSNEPGDSNDKQNTEIDNNSTGNGYPTDTMGGDCQLEDGGIVDCEASTTGIVAGLPHDYWWIEKMKVKDDEWQEHIEDGDEKNRGDGRSFKKPPQQRFTKGDVQVTVSGTSPQTRIRDHQLKNQEHRRHREKTWLRKDPETTTDSGSECRQGEEEINEVKANGDCSTVLTEHTTTRGSVPPGISSADNETAHNCGPGRVMIPLVDNANESTLEEIYPFLYAKSLSRLRIIENTTDIFLSSIGVRTNLKMGSTAFRSFARKCQLNQLGFTSATVDIIYIDLQRRWEYIYPDNGQGLCFQAFLEAFFKIAVAKFSREGDQLYAVRRMINHCRIHMGLMEGPVNEKEAEEQIVKLAQ